MHIVVIFFNKLNFFLLGAALFCGSVTIANPSSVDYLTNEEKIYVCVTQVKPQLNCESNLTNASGTEVRCSINVSGLNVESKESFQKQYLILHTVTKKPDLSQTVEDLAVASTLTILSGGLNLIGGFIKLVFNGTESEKMVYNHIHYKLNLFANDFLPCMDYGSVPRSENFDLSSLKTVVPLILAR